MNSVNDYNLVKSNIDDLIGAKVEDRTTAGNSLSQFTFQLSICIPKPCTTHQAMTSLLFNLTAIGFNYEDLYCRLPDDKPWVAADYIAVVIFSIIGFLALISTSYDLYHTLYLKRDPKEANKLCQSFSIYTNGRRLMTFTNNKDSLLCLDGIRSLAMLWVIVGHTFSTVSFMRNPLDAIQWILSAKSLWITSAQITVDTFFMISGLLVVYTMAGKITGLKFLKNLHLFYLNRFMRIFPLLATTVLLQVSIFNRIIDGPHWKVVAQNTENCRKYWWSTLISIQNFYNPNEICHGHTWYIAVDFQLYIISPIILFWVLGGGKKGSWIALTTALLACLTAATTYNFINNFPASSLQIQDAEESMNYIAKYYIHTLPRASPFFVGMLFGYLLHIWKGQKIKLNIYLVLFLWACALTIFSLIIYTTYVIIQVDWDNQFANNFINSYIRPGWATALGWLIFACAKGYGGPINWFLSLDCWRLPARLSFAMYLLHYPLQFIRIGAAREPAFFSVEGFLFKFFGDLVLTVIISYIAMILIDAPCSTLFKLMLGGGPKKTKEIAKETNVDAIENEEVKANGSSKYQ